MQRQNLLAQRLASTYGSNIAHVSTNDGLHLVRLFSLKESSGSKLARLEAVWS